MTNGGSLALARAGVVSALLLAGLMIVPPAAAFGPPTAATRPVPRVSTEARSQVLSEPAVTTAAPSDSGAWGPVLDWGQQAKHMALLPTGRVLVWSTGNNARVWDPASGTFTLAPATFGDLHCAGQSHLADGRVIIVGGQQGSPHAGTAITALFDPVTETWTQGQSMHDLRWYATSTTLADGRVLATSGDAPDGSRSMVSEVYDPTSNTWTKLTGATRDQSLYPFMFVLPDGRVYDSGPKTSTAIFDTAGIGSLTPGPTGLYSTNGYSESAVMYAPGRILRAGGGDPAQARASVIDMTAASPAWRDTTPMSFPRRRMNLTILADGTIMAIGGTRSGDSAAAAVLEGEIWNPVTELWTTVEAMTEARMYHSSAVLLADGRVVVGGGESAGRLRAQVYSPPYLFGGPRPAIASAPATAGYATTFTVATPDASTIASVALIRPGAATHALDMNQRYVPLGFTTGDGTLSVNAPAGSGYAPPGDYMLIVKTDAGVPSVAHWIRIGTAGSIQTGSISGTITDAATGDPVADATVASSAGTTTSAADGSYTIADAPAGLVLVTFSAAGFATESRQATVVGGAMTTLDLALQRPGTVTGAVTDATSGAPLAGVTVGYPGGTTTTDATGAYVVDGLPAGDRDLTFGLIGYTTAQRTAAVPAGGSVGVEVALEQVAEWIAGEVRDIATNAVITTATVSVTTGQTTTTDSQGRYRIDLPPGTYTVTAAADGYDATSAEAVVTAGAYATVDLSLSASIPSGPLVTTASRDGHVKSTSPTKAYGTLTTMRIKAPSSPTDDTFASYVRFDVSGIVGRSIQSARLHLYATDGGPHGGTVFPTATTWQESSLTWGSAPPPTGAALGSIGSVGVNQWISFSLPAGTVTADGAYAFRIAGGSTNSVFYSTREGSNPPRLELVLGPGGPPPPPAPPVAAFTASPPSGPAPLGVTVTDTSTGAPTSWSWDFGDGSTATGQVQPVHSYANPGPYTIRLTVGNAGGSATTTRSITVDPPLPPPGATRIKDVTFEAGLLEAVHGVDSVTGAVTLETANPIGGTASARVSNSAAYLQEIFSATDDLHVRFLLRITSLPAGAPRLVLISNGGTTQTNLLLTSAGRLRLRVGTTMIGADSAPLAPGTTYVVGIHQRRGSGSNGVAEAFLAPLGGSFGAPFAATTTGTWKTAADRLRIGGTNGTAVSVVVDDMLLDGATMPSAPQTAAGSAAVPALLASATVPAGRSLTRGAMFVCPI